MSRTHVLLQISGILQFFHSVPLHEQLKMEGDPIALVEEASMVRTARAHSETFRANNGSLHPAQLRINSAQLTVGSKTDVLVEILAPSTQKRAPLDASLVIDVSGSMDTWCPLPGSDSRGPQLSTLDLVKHAVTTIIETATAEDRIGIVVFADDARVVLPLTFMSADGKSDARAIVQAMKTEGCTNLWAGLTKAIEQLQSRRGNAGGETPGLASRQAAVLALTDGQPNTSPARGELAELRRLGMLDFSIWTFGFGYGLDSKLLSELAVEGNGSYAFIPDATMIATVFINTLSSLRSTYASNAKLSIPAVIKVRRHGSGSASGSSDDDGTVSVALKLPAAPAHASLGFPALTTGSSSTHASDPDTATATADSMSGARASGGGYVVLHVGNLQCGSTRAFVLRGTVVEAPRSAANSSAGGFVVTGSTATADGLRLQYVDLATGKMVTVMDSGGSSATAMQVGTPPAAAGQPTLAISVPDQLCRELRFHKSRLLLSHALVTAHAIASKRDAADCHALAASEITKIIEKIKKLDAENRPSSSHSAGTAPAINDDDDDDHGLYGSSGAIGGTDIACIDARVTALLKDASEQAMMAVSRHDYFQKWGRHYVPSLARAHAVQLCNNFKDPGVQVRDAHACC